MFEGHFPLINHGIKPYFIHTLYNVYRVIKYAKVTTVKHVYSDHAYNEMTLIMKHLEIPGKHSLYFFINFTLTAKLHITKSRL